MKSPFLALCGLATLGVVHAIQGPTCVDCAAPLLLNPDWSNGVIATGNYYAPSRGAGWGLGTSRGFLVRKQHRYSST